MGDFKSSFQSLAQLKSTYCVIMIFNSFLICFANSGRGAMSEYDLKTQKYFAKVDKRRQKYLEAAKQNPASYKRHVFHMAIIAILVPTVLVVALFGFLVFDVVSIFDDARDSIFGINTQVVLLFIIISLLSALRVNMGKPEGIEISPEDAPNLFSMINDLHSPKNLLNFGNSKIISLWVCHY